MRSTAVSIPDMAASSVMFITGGGTAMPGGRCRIGMIRTMAPVIGATDGSGTVTAKFENSSASARDLRKEGTRHVDRADRELSLFRQYMNREAIKPCIFPLGFELRVMLNSDGPQNFAMLPGQPLSSSGVVSL